MGESFFGMGITKKFYDVPCSGKMEHLRIVVKVLTRSKSFVITITSGKEDINPTQANNRLQH